MNTKNCVLALIMVIGGIIAGHVQATSPHVAHAFTIMSLSPSEMSLDQKKVKLQELMDKHYALLYEVETVGRRNLLQGAALRNDKPMYEFFAAHMGYAPNFEADVKRETELEAIRLAAFQEKYPDQMSALRDAEQKLKDAQDAMDKINAMRGEPNIDVARDIQQTLSAAQKNLAEIRQKIDAIMIADRDYVEAQNEVNKANSLLVGSNSLAVRALQEAVSLAKQKLNQALREYDDFVKNMR